MVPPPSGDQDWQFDKFHDGGAKGTSLNFPLWRSSSLFFIWIELVLNAQLKRYRRFLATHKQALRRIEDTLGTNVTQTWDFDLNPVELQVQFLFFNRLKIARLNFLQYLPYEQVQVLELIRTENKICNKIVTVLAAICCECKFLVYECERKFLPAILFFGEGGTFIDDLVHELISISS